MASSKIKLSSKPLRTVSMQRRELRQKIYLLKQIAPRADWVAGTKELLMAQIRRQGLRSAAAAPSPLEWVLGSRFWQTVFGVVRQPALGLVAALGLVLATSLTVNAAFYSLPGEPLYKMKLVFERTQLAFVTNSTRKTELKVEFARNRVKELGQLVSQGNDGKRGNPEVGRAVSRFTQEVSSVREDLRRLPADHRAAFKIALSVEQAGSELAERLPAGDTLAEPAVTLAVRLAVATAEATSYSALEAAIANTANATSSQPLPASEVSKYLGEKISRLRAQVEPLAAGGGDGLAAALSLRADLDAAEHEVAGGNFPAALAKISAVKEQLGSWDGSQSGAGSAAAGGSAKPAAGVAAEGGPDANASSTEAVGVGEGTRGGGVETTQGFLP